VIRTSFSFIYSSIHFSSPYSQYSESSGRQTTVLEIALVLQREAKGLSEVSMTTLAQTIYEEATRYEYDPKFLLALISIESSFRTSSVSPRGAMGLMQLMPDVAEAIAPQLNIEWHGEGILLTP
jgi:soluble lytic murein transglycosylase-like protein